jgi:LPXTG-site transpeptidase (sortase) family protein
VVGALFLILGVCCILFAVLNGWIRSRNRFLVAGGIVDHTLIMPTRTPTPEMPMAYTAAGGSQAGGSQEAWPDVTSGRAAPARIRIPDLRVDRAIIELQQIRHPRTGAWSRDVDRLFRRGRQDLVGHWGGSAYPGGEGNVVLVGHNYTYTGTGVFLSLGRLESGHQIEVIDQDGQTFVYEVSHVERVPWQRQDAGELERHSDLLYAGGPERLTLVTCAGGGAAPFAQRVYVVATPVY